MGYKVTIEDFEGPLDLLLQLIQKKQLDISEISLSEVTDQFLEHLQAAEAAHPHELADFLDVASRLVYIKSRALLPFLEPEEEEGPPLEEQLKLYREFHEASKKIEEMIEARRFMYARPKMKVTEVVFHPPEELKPFDLKQAMENVLDNLEPVIKLPQAIMQRTVSLQERMCDIQDSLTAKVKTSFNKITKKGNRMDTVVSFLAVLELLKQQFLCVRQEDTFSDIELEKAS